MNFVATKSNTKSGHTKSSISLTTDVVDFVYNVTPVTGWDRL